VERKQIAVLVAGVIALVAVIGLAAGPASRYAAARQAAEDEKNKEAICADYLDKKIALLVKNCLDEHRLQSRQAEAHALVDAELRARSEGIAKLNGNPAVVAMLKRLSEAKKSEPTLSIGFRLAPVAPVYFTLGGTHTPNFLANDIVQDLNPSLEKKVPALSLWVISSGCDTPASDPRLDATIVLHEGTGNITLKSGNTTVGVRMLTYDIDVVACYENERVSLANIKGQPMPLHENFSLRSDERSAADMAYQQMDRQARYAVMGILDRALGI
jgi:hypothetical protein